MAPRSRPLPGQPTMRVGPWQPKPKAWRPKPKALHPKPKALPLGYVVVAFQAAEQHG